MKRLIQTKTLLLKISWELLFFKQELYYTELNMIKSSFSVREQPILEPEQPWVLPSIYLLFFSIAFTRQYWISHW